MEPLFRDRRDAGRVLADKLRSYAGQPDVVVLGLPRGGVPVAFEVATALDAPLDVVVVRKLGVPGHEELAMGAIASGGTRVVNDAIVRELGIPDAVIEAVTEIEETELRRRERHYRGSRSPLDLAGRTVILVDDGLATGSSMRVAAEAVSKCSPDRLVAAAPVAAHATCEAFRDVVDGIVCAATPEPLLAVGLWYEDFLPTSDWEVHELLEAARARSAGSSGPA